MVRMKMINNGGTCKLHRETISFPQTPKDQFRMLYLYYLCSPLLTARLPLISMANYRTPINTIIDRSSEERCSQHILLACVVDSMP